MSAFALLAYVVVEVAAFVALAHVVGILPTLGIMLVVWWLGLWLVRIRARRIIVGTGAEALTEITVTAAGSLLMILPGVVTSLLGVLLVFPWTRRALRAPARRLLGRYSTRLGAAADIFAPRAGEAAHTGEVIEGEVVDETTPGETPHRPGYMLGEHRSAD